LGIIGVAKNIVGRGQSLTGDFTQSPLRHDRSALGPLPIFPLRLRDSIASHCVAIAIG
jgi:hypothetical protein